MAGKNEKLIEWYQELWMLILIRCDASNPTQRMLQEKITTVCNFRSKSPTPSISHIANGAWRCRGIR